VLRSGKGGVNAQSGAAVQKPNLADLRKGFSGLGGRDVEGQKPEQYAASCDVKLEAARGIQRFHGFQIHPLTGGNQR
jgi:hypothetical protein